MRLFFLIVLFWGCSSFCTAQSDPQKEDSVKTRKQIYRGPRRAAILSAILPGLGQAYNHKYWKIPIIYAGIAGFGYMFYIKNADYHYFSSNLAAMHDKDPGTVNVTGYSSEALIALKDDAKRNRDISLIGLAVVYAFNIVDANVDGHLKTFDVSDNLGLQLKPVLLSSTHSALAMGLGIKLKFK